MTTDFKQSKIVTLAQTGNASFSGFRANRNDYAGLFDPLIGFDHYRLSSDVFGPHQHRHMSALSYLFDDSANYHNKDSMGNDLTITTGSLLWTWAGSGVTHHEFPEEANAKIHGLQLFLDIPAETRNLPPKSILIPVEEMPVQETNGVRVKVVMGSAANLANKIETPEAITFLDVTIAAGKTFKQQMPTGFNGTLYLLSGTLQVVTPAGISVLNANDTIAMGQSAEDVQIILNAQATCRLLFISGRPVL